MKGAKPAGRGRKRGATKPRAPAAATDDAKSAAAAERRKERQAVIVVHGMGEQKPLETLRAFVEAVWGRRPTPGSQPDKDDVWLVPDTRSGLTELARITTRHANGVRTDFFELYWSDLLVGNTLAQIRGWVTGLLLRWPHQVPREARSLWLSLWVLVAAILALAAFVGISGAAKSLWTVLSEASPVRNQWGALASVVLAGGLYYVLRRRLGANLRKWHKPDEVFLGIWSTVTPRQSSLSVWWSRLAAPALAIAIGAAAYLWFPWTVLLALKPWLLILAALLAFVLTWWVVPVFGDVARYVRTSPDAVQARAAIRERGVKLLRALHGPMQDETAKSAYDPGDESSYTRIVVVGHSLGSIVAYDMLRLFWQERGPTGGNPATSAGTLRALRALDNFCRKASPDPDRFDIAKFRTLQHGVARALAGEPDGWRVSDFVTLGSPLTHAEFLVSNDRAAFEERKAERLFPTCPPMMEPDRIPSFLYAGFSLAHHAAMFAAMRWTNIHDPRRRLILGDFISGPCRPNFGPGVVDVAVNIRKGGLFSRVVTHTDYWNAEADGFAEDAEGNRLGIDNISAEPKAHLALLRKAMALR